MAAEDEAKPPAKADQEGKNRPGGRGGNGKAFKAPTPGLELEYFDWSTSQSKTVRYIRAIEKLANHVGTNFGDYAAAAAAAVRDRQAPVFREPEKPKLKKNGDRDEYEIKREIWRDDYKEYAKAKRAWENINCQRLYNLFLSHCTPEMVTKLKGWVEETTDPDAEKDNWEKLSARQDGLALIRVLHQFAHDKDGVTAGMQEIVDADCALYACKQGRSSEVDYLREFKARVDTINESGG